MSNVPRHLRGTYKNNTVKDLRKHVQARFGNLLTRGKMSKAQLVICAQAATYEKAFKALSEDPSYKGKLPDPASRLPLVKRAKEASESQDGAEVLPDGDTAEA